MQSQHGGPSSFLLFSIGGIGALCLYKIFKSMSFQSNTPYHHGALGRGTGNLYTPVYADQYSPVNNVGRKYVDVDSRLAVKVSEQIKKEK